MTIHSSTARNEELLKLSRNPKSIELLKANIRADKRANLLGNLLGKQEFIVYASLGEARKKNDFLESDIADKIVINADNHVLSIGLWEKGKTQ